MHALMTSYGQILLLSALKMNAKICARLARPDADAGAAGPIKARIDRYPARLEA